LLVWQDPSTAKSPQRASKQAFTDSEYLGFTFSFGSCKVFASLVTKSRIIKGVSDSQVLAIEEKISIAGFLFMGVLIAFST